MLNPYIKRETLGANNQPTQLLQAQKTGTSIISGSSNHQINRVVINNTTNANNMNRKEIKLTVKCKNSLSGACNNQGEQYSVPKVFMSCSPLLKQLLKTKSTRIIQYEVPEHLNDKLFPLIFSLLNEMQEEDYAISEASNAWTPTLDVLSNAQQSNTTNNNTHNSISSSLFSLANNNKNISNPASGSTASKLPYHTNKVEQYLQKRSNFRVCLQEIQLCDLVPLYLLVDHLRITFLSWLLCYRIHFELQNSAVSIEQLAKLF